MGHGGFGVGSRPARGHTHCQRGSGQIHGQCGSRPTASMGLAHLVGSFMAVSLRWLRGSFFGSLFGFIWCFELILSK